MARKQKKLSTFHKFLIISLALITIQVTFLLFFGGDTKPVTIREAITKTVRSQTDITEERREQMRIQLALADFRSKKNKYPASLDELVPEYFDFVPNDPSTSKPFAYTVVKNRYTLGTPKERPKGGKSGAETESGVDPAVLAALENDTQRASFTYDPTGKRDPFQPFDFSPKGIDTEGKTPLELYTPGQLKYTSFLGGQDEAIAMVENAAGRGFTVRKGTKIGTNGGVVVDILPTKILILEETTDFTGVKKSQTIELELRSKGHDSKANPNFKRH